MSHTVLIVEDDLPTCMLWTRHLAFAGWETQVAHNVGDAIEAFLKYEPRAVILDVTLSDEESGWDVLSKIRGWSAKSETPVLVISAMEVPHRALREGATAFLLKPCPPQVVVNAIAQHCA